MLRYYCSYRFLVPCLFFIAIHMARVSRSRWNETIQSLQEELLTDGNECSTVSSPSSQNWNDLPVCVRRYLTRVFTDPDTLPLGSKLTTAEASSSAFSASSPPTSHHTNIPLIRSASIHQTGQLQFPNIGWIPFCANQSLTPHGFVWKAHLRLLHHPMLLHQPCFQNWLSSKLQSLLFTATVVDAYVANVGHLHVRMLSDAAWMVRSEELPQAVLLEAERLRWLAEAALIPTVLLPESNLVQWTTINHDDDDDKQQNQAIATFQNVSLRFQFDDNGWITRVSGTRAEIRSVEEIVYREWVGYFSNYRWNGVVWVPTHMEAGHVVDGDVEFYFRGENLNVDYDYYERKI